MVLAEDEKSSRALLKVYQSRSFMHMQVNTIFHQKCNGLRIFYVFFCFTNFPERKRHFFVERRSAQTMFTEYSQLSLKRIPSGPKLLSGLERCPL